MGRPLLGEPSPPSPMNRCLDAITAPRDELFGVPAPPYLVLGAVGVMVGFVLLAGLGLHAGVPLALSAVLTVGALAVFVAAGLLRSALGSAARHVLLEDVLLVLTASAAIARATGRPVLVVLDLCALALGGFLVFGRLGCLVGGCCHGRPSRVGARHHRDDPRHGVRLFPVQLVEAGWLAAVTTVGIAVLLAPAAPGRAVELWSIALVSGRFVFELARGDVGRPRLGPMTEAQWLGVLVVAGWVAYEEVTRPRADVALLVACGGALTLVAVGALTRRRWLAFAAAPTVDDLPAWQLFLADLEFEARAAADGARRPGPGGVEVALDVDGADGGRELHALTWRHPARELGLAEGCSLAGLALQRLPAHRLVAAGRGAAGSFHLWVVVEPGGPPGSSPGDDPRLVQLRAQAAAALVRTAALRAPAWPHPLDRSALPPG